ncbi:MAG: NAD-dependent epimerase/dehydratase family protein [Alphaproteobacteria bacterium]|nr:NAD-dependent epimerase/dehydratase family protein [Alphaproteobacteria bacterium]
MAPATTPRLAIIGCGALVDHHLSLALRRIGWLPRVLVDTSPQRIDVVARKFGSRCKGAIKAPEWQSVAGEFDAAIVAVPPSLHGKIGASLAEAGKHVFMEKPLATTADQCWTMIAAAERSKVTLSVGLLRRYLQVARWTKALLEAGILGDFVRFEAREGFVFNWDISTIGMIQPQLAGGGVLIDTGAHTIDLLRWWLGDLTLVGYRDDNRGGVEADCIVDCRLANGATGSIELSRTRELSNTLRIEGTKGFVEVHLYKNEVRAASPNVLAFRADGVGVTDMKQQFFAELFDAELKDFLTSASGTTTVGVAGRAAVDSVALIEQCYAAREPLLMPWQGSPTAATAPRSDRPRLPAGSKVLITGATGFIGGRLAEQLVQEHGAQVRCLVRNLGRSTRLARMPVELIQADLADAAQIDAAVRGVDYVFHCAYDVRSRKQNVDAVANLLQSCKRHAVRRFVHVSTFSVYEPFPDGVVSEATPAGDRAWVYVNTKLDLEKAVLGAARSEGVPATIIQPAIVYGPFCQPWTNAPAEMLIYGNVVLPERADGLCNAVYIDDLTDGMLRAAIDTAAIGERFVISGPRPVTWSAFFTEFASALNTAPPQFWPKEEIAKTNYGLVHDVRMVLSNPKMIIQIIVRWPPARRALQAGLDSMPPPLRKLVMTRYFGGGGRRIGQDFLPDKQKLALYTAKPVVSNEKAERLLGYRPRFDFKDGMAATRRYLEWAYGDTSRYVKTQRAPVASAAISPAAGFASAD